MKKDKKGKLIVLEGPDNAGKTELASRLSQFLDKKGIKHREKHFPGKQNGTLGDLVNSIHHAHEKEFNIEHIDPTSMQLLHIAAHIDAIENRFKGYLRNGEWLILDRFWWSAWVYGKHGKANNDSIERMINIEKAHWEEFNPTLSFLLVRNESQSEDRAILYSEYRKLLKSDHVTAPVETLDNNGSIEKTLDRLIDELDYHLDLNF